RTPAWPTIRVRRCNTGSSTARRSSGGTFEGRPIGRPSSRSSCVLRSELLDLDGGAGLLEIGLELVGLLALDALLDGLRSLVDERLGLLETEAGRRADDLDDLDLLVARGG